MFFHFLTGAKTSKRGVVNKEEVAKLVDDTYRFLLSIIPILCYSVYDYYFG